MVRPERFDSRPFGSKNNGFRAPKRELTDEQYRKMKESQRLTRIFYPTRRR
jgi:hypothetical protein